MYKSESIDKFSTLCYQAQMKAVRLSITEDNLKKGIK